MYFICKLCLQHFRLKMIPKEQVVLQSIHGRWNLVYQIFLLKLYQRIHQIMMPQRYFQLHCILYLYKWIKIGKCSIWSIRKFEKLSYDSYSYVHFHDMYYMIYMLYDSYNCNNNRFAIDKKFKGIFCQLYHLLQIQTYLWQLIFVAHFVKYCLVQQQFGTEGDSCMCLWKSMSIHMYYCT